MTNDDQPDMGAFELVDYLLYGYAVLVFLKSTMFGVYNNISFAVSAPYFAIGITFLSVILRNYTVMRSIDHFDHTNDERYSFLFYLGPVSRLIERLARLLIIFAVVATPKGTFQFASLPLQRVADWAMSTLFLAPVSELHKAQDPAAVAVREGLYYYAVVLLVLCLSFFVWDAVVTVAIAGKIREGKIDTAIDMKEQSVPDAAYRSILCYYNICGLRKWGATKPSEISFKSIDVHNPWRRKSLVDGNIVKIYLGSPKFRERLLGIFVALGIFFMSASQFSAIAVALLFTLTAFYLASAWKNDRYLYSILIFPLIWLTYVAKRATLQVAISSFKKAAHLQ